MEKTKKQNSKRKFTVAVFLLTIFGIMMIFTGCNVIKKILFSPIRYTAVFIAEGKEVYSKDFTVETKEIHSPEVPQKNGYTGSWEAYEISAGDITVSAIYTPTPHKIKFMFRGAVVDEFDFTVESFDFTEPKVPDFLGCIGEWEDYDLTTQYTDLNVEALYTSSYATSGLEYTKVADGYAVTKYVGQNPYVQIPEYYRNSPVFLIANNAFTNNLNMITVSLPKTLRNIGRAAFDGCEKLVEVNNYSPIYFDKNDEVANGCIAKYALSIINNGAETEITQQGNFKFIQKNGINYLVDYIGTSGNVFLPSSFNGAEYTIKKYAFYNNNDILSLVVPQGVKTIETYAFAKCENLGSIKIDEGVQNIGENAFTACGNLINLVIANSVKKIGFNAFGECKNLAKISMPIIGITKDDQVFDNLSAMFGTTSENSGEQPLSLKEITINGAAKIGSTVFSLFYVEKVIIACQIASIDKRAFSGSSKLTNIIFSEGVNLSVIDEYAFNDCENLESINLPNSVTTIGTYAFSNCKKLKSVNIGELSLLSSVGASAFQKCKSLASFYFPSKLKTISSYMFQSCATLSLLNYANDSAIDMIGNGAFSECSMLKEIELFSSLKEIGTNAFGNLINLKTIRLNSNMMNDLTSESNAFSYAGQSSEGITLLVGENVSRVPAYLFHTKNSSVNLTKVEFAENSLCESIDAFAFANCVKLLSITIPKKIKNIKESAFTRCEKVETIYFNSENCLDLELSDSAFAFVGQKGVGTTVIVGQTVTRIPACLFYSDTMMVNITKVEYAENAIVNSIGSYAFANCLKLSEIKIIESITEIGQRAFSETRNVTKILFYAANCGNLNVDSQVFFNSGNSGSGIYLHIGQKATRIPDYLFCVASSYVPKITNVAFDAGSVCSSIGKYAFNSAINLSSLEIPRTITTIGDNAFAYCHGLTNINFDAENCQNFNSQSLVFLQAGYTSVGITVTIGNAVTKVPDYLFSANEINSSPNIKNVTFSVGSVCDTIGSYAFSYLKMTEFFIPITISVVKSGAFFSPQNLVVFTKHTAAPTQWASDWNISSCSVIWDCDYQKQTYFFVTNGGEPMDNIFAVALLVEPVPVKENCTFDGWYDNSYLTGNRVSFPYYTKKTNGEDKVLYAKWIENPVEQVDLLEK